MFSSFRSSPALVSTKEKKSNTSSPKITGDSQAPSSSTDYIATSLLGQSAYGEVVLATTKQGKKVVLKKINRLKMNKTLIANEVFAATTLKHAGVVKVYDVFRESIYTYLVLEYLKGVDLFKFLSARNFTPMREKEARPLFRQLVDALLYCHSRKIAHRDIKLENIMYDKKKNRVKIIDFGLCERIDSGKLCDLWCGSQDYVCPEIIKKTPYNGFAADVWSLGTILYIMLYGELPFGFDMRVKCVSDGEEHPDIHFADERNPNTVSESAKHLISSMLTVDPMKRISMEEVAKHRWTRTKSPLDLFGWS
ncbi:hypothetical protein PROFUN_00388 [Planoprotostelium fungivorum]|uniref:non-specific serine/threonine protein kinase n=1 Tax=Planoprotostelium fungivorum TaxID=1890364 RepID=A0A2P6NYA0_9EUKA|nr:hypothetical protein PROFUN_00388 [Planoprotostelium fungivorum]